MYVCQQTGGVKERERKGEDVMESPKKSPVACLVVGMAGAGKSTFLRVGVPLCSCHTHMCVCVCVYRDIMEG